VASPQPDFSTFPAPRPARSITSRPTLPRGDAVKGIKEHYGELVVDAVTDREYDKIDLPADLALTHYLQGA